MTGYEAPNAKGRVIVMTQTEKSIIECIGALSEEQQRFVLKFARGLRNQSPPGIPPDELIRRVDEIDFPSKDLEEMKQAIDEDCERIDEDGW